MQYLATKTPGHSKLSCSKNWQYRTRYASEISNTRIIKLELEVHIMCIPVLNVMPVKDYRQEDKINTESARAQNKTTQNKKEYNVIHT